MFDGESRRDYIEQLVETVAHRYQLNQKEKEQLCSLVFDSLSTNVSVPEQHEEAFEAVNLMLQTAGYSNCGKEASGLIQRAEVDWTNSPAEHGIQERRIKLHGS